MPTAALCLQRGSDPFVLGQCRGTVLSVSCRSSSVLFAGCRAHQLSSSDRAVHHQTLPRLARRLPRKLRIPKILRWQLTNTASHEVILMLCSVTCFCCLSCRHQCASIVASGFLCLLPDQRFALLFQFI